MHLADIPTEAQTLAGKLKTARDAVLSQELRLERARSTVESEERELVRSHATVEAILSDIDALSAIAATAIAAKKNAGLPEESLGQPGSGKHAGEGIATPHTDTVAPAPEALAEAALPEDDTAAADGGASHGLSPGDEASPSTQPGASDAYRAARTTSAPWDPEAAPAAGEVEERADGMFARFFRPTGERA